MFSSEQQLLKEGAVINLYYCFKELFQQWQKINEINTKRRITHQPVGLQIRAHIPAVRGCRPCADLKRFITDSKARSPKQREAEKTFMLKISCPNRETQFSSQGRYPNGCRLQQSLTAKGECDPSISTLHKEEIYKLECFLSL